MFIQGNLQAVFDALFEVGAIDPILKMDWRKVTKEIYRNPDRMESALKQVNCCEGRTADLKEVFSKLDSQSLNFIAMEVAREFAEFQDRSNLH